MEPGLGARTWNPERSNVRTLNPSEPGTWNLEPGTRASVNLRHQSPFHLSKVLPVSLSCRRLQRALFEGDCQQQVETTDRRELEAGHGHHRRGEQHQVPAGVDRMADPAVRSGRLELR